MCLIFMLTDLKEILLLMSHTGKYLEREVGFQIIQVSRVGLLDTEAPGPTVDTRKGIHCAEA